MYMYMYIHLHVHTYDNTSDGKKERKKDRHLRQWKNENELSQVRFEPTM